MPLDVGRTHSALSHSDAAFVRQSEEIEVQSVLLAPSSRLFGGTQCAS